MYILREFNKVVNILNQLFKPLLNLLVKGELDDIYLIDKEKSLNIK